MLSLIYGFFLMEALMNKKNKEKKMPIGLIHSKYGIDVNMIICMQRLRSGNP